MSTITVNLNVNVDASGNVNVFSQAPTVPTENVVVAEATAPISILYNSANDGLIQFQGSNNDLIAQNNSSFTTTVNDIGNALHAVINSGFDGSAAYPFNKAKYNSEPAYRNYDSFGHLALASYTDYLFGHVAATAAIDNDSIFINRMNGETNLDAKIASRLAADIKSLSIENCLSITQQVLGQDASRATMVDNDGPTWQTLEFKNGDSIFMAVNLLQPTVNVLNSQAITNLPSAANYSSIMYHLKVFLSGPTEVIAPDLSGVVSIISVELGTGIINYDATETRTAYLRIKDYGVTTNYTGTTFTTTGGQLNYTTLLGIPLITHSAQSEITFMDAATNQPISNTLNLGNPATIGGLTITGINLETGAVSYTTTGNCIELVFVVTNNSGVDTFYNGIFNIYGATSGSIHFPTFTGGASLADLQGQTLSIAFRYNHYDRASVNGVMIGSPPPPPPGPTPSGSVNGWVVDEGGIGSVAVNGITTTFTATNGQMTNFRNLGTTTSGAAFSLTLTVVEAKPFTFALFDAAGGPPKILLATSPLSNGLAFWEYNPMSGPDFLMNGYAVDDVLTVTYNPSNNTINLLKNGGAPGTSTSSIALAAGSYILRMNMGSTTNNTVTSFNNLAFTV